MQEDASLVVYDASDAKAAIGCGCSCQLRTLAALSLLRHAWRWLRLRLRLLWRDRTCGGGLLTTATTSSSSTRSTRSTRSTIVIKQGIQARDEHRSLLFSLIIDAAAGLLVMIRR